MCTIHSKSRPNQITVFDPRTSMRHLRDWADGKIEAGEEPPWAWYQYMKLIETIDAISEAGRTVRRTGRGRDGHCWPPPAQTRTCGITAYETRGQTPVKLVFARAAARAAAVGRRSTFSALGPRRLAAATLRRSKTSKTRCPPRPWNLTAPAAGHNADPQ